MLFIFLIFIIICMYKSKFNKNGYDDYLEKQQTTMTKGIFAMIIFFSHFNSYINLNNNCFNNIYLKIFNIIGQLCVVLFFFYSGYGIYLSSKNKDKYFEKFGKDRILKTIISFDVAVILYLIVDVIVGNKYDVKTILFSLIGWDSVGNSNWFIFVIIVLYLITYIIAKISKNKLNKKSLIAITACSMVLIFTLYFFKQSWWYDTLLCYPLGMWYAYYKEKIDGLLKKKFNMIFIVISILFVTLFKLRNNNFIIYEIMSCVFCILYTFATYKYKISNSVLNFLGKYSFEIYIIQRLPYMIINKYTQNYYLIFVLNLLLTIILAIGLKKLTQFVNDKILINKMFFKHNKEDNGR